MTGGYISTKMKDSHEAVFNSRINSKQAGETQEKQPLNSDETGQRTENREYIQYTQTK